MKTPWRDDRGRYIEHDAWDRVCVCGHELGQHAAAKIGWRRDCLECMCETFKLDQKAVSK